MQKQESEVNHLQEEKTPEDIGNDQNGYDGDSNDNLNVEHTSPEGNSNVVTQYLGTRPQSSSSIPPQTSKQNAEPSLTLLQHIVGLVKPRDRSKQYDPLVEVLPGPLLLLLVVLMLLCVIFVLFLALFLVPSGNQQDVLFHRYNDQIYNGSASIVHELRPKLSHNNVNLLFSLSFGFNNTYTGIVKNNLRMKMTLEGKNDNQEQYHPIVSNVEHTRSLRCVQDDYYLYLMYTGNNFILLALPECRELTLFHEHTIDYNTYRATITFENLKTLHDANLVQGMIVTRYIFTNAAYTLFELILRLIFSALSVVIFVNFSIIMIRASEFKKWHTAQKWLYVLLFLMIFFHDPLYLFVVFLPNEFLSFLHVIFTLNFTYAFLLYLLIFFHSLFRKRGERGFFSFYLTKFLLIVPAYLLTVVLFTWSRVYNYMDPSYTSVTSVPGFLYMEAILLVLLMAYAISLLYYIIRSIASTRKFNRNLSPRFKAVGSFSFIVIISLTGVGITSRAFRDSAAGISFLVTYFVVFFFYMVMSLLFLPSMQESKKPTPDRNIHTRLQQFSQNQQQDLQMVDVDLGPPNDQHPPSNDENHSDNRNASISFE